MNDDARVDVPLDTLGAEGRLVKGDGCVGAIDHEARLDFRSDFDGTHERTLGGPARRVLKKILRGRTGSG
jgi:hypothetical protein